MKHLLNEQITINIMEGPVADPFKWTSGSVATLIQLIKENWDDFNNAMKKKKCLWKEISAKMIASGYFVPPVECDKKFRNIKTRYYLALENKLLKKKKRVRIEYFDELHSFLGDQPSTKAKLEQRQQQLIDDDMQTQVFNMLQNSGDNSDEDYSFDEDEWPLDAVENFLCLLKEFKDCFNGPTDNSFSVDVIWNVVSEHMQLKGLKYTSDECSQQWQILLNNYHFYRQSGQTKLWAFFETVEDVILTVPIPFKGKKRKLPQLQTREAKEICLELPFDETTPMSSIKIESLEDTTPMSSIKIESLEDSFDAQEDTAKSDGKYAQLLNALKAVEERLSIWKQLKKQEANIDNKLASFERKLEERNSILGGMASEASKLEAALKKRFCICEQGTENITLVIPNSGDNNDNL